MNNKYYMICRECGQHIDNFSQWFSFRQKCPSCGKNWVDVKYNIPISGIKNLINANTNNNSFFHYFDYLPLNDKRYIISSGEGAIPVDIWKFPEKFALEKYGINCKVWAYRNDLNMGTGTFKDVAAAMAASVLKENNIKDYSVASTGNIASAFAHYLAMAGISLSVFIPNDALKANEAEINSHGQRVYRVNGDYAKAKHIAAEFSEKFGILLSGGNIDPMRVEAKKTMVFEWLKQKGELPTIYIQALSGGTGPIAIDKAIDDLKELNIINSYPRFIMVQPDRCDPMTAGWEKAKTNNFPEGWENDYPVYNNPETLIPTLATGNPKTFPIIASLVKKSKGEIISFKEEDAVDVARIVAFEQAVNIGPAAAIAMGGFFESLKKGLIKNGDIVMINIGEGVMRAPEFMEEMMYTTEHINSIEDCKKFERSLFRKKLWEKFY